jgi:hypothetical protein
MGQSPIQGQSSLLQSAWLPRPTDGVTRPMALGPDLVPMVFPVAERSGKRGERTALEYVPWRSSSQGRGGGGGTCMRLQTLVAATVVGPANAESIP